jgi:hypothetical protein
MSPAQRTSIAWLTAVTLATSLGCSPQLAQRVVIEGAFWALGESVRAQQRQREQQAQLARDEALRQEFNQKLALVRREAGQGNVQVPPNGTEIYREAAPAIPGVASSTASQGTDLYRPRGAGLRSDPGGFVPSETVCVATGTPRAASGAGVRLAKNVNINMASPAVGTAPHYIAFNVDLPPEVIRDAHFVWMDNGMWICDEPKGVKILETPGRHRISVLVVTKDGQDYRGTRDVVVLAAVSDSSRRAPRVGMP